MLLNGMMTIGRIALAGIISRKNKNAKQKSYVYFTDLGPGNLPQEAGKLRSYDIISWYLQWPGRKDDITEVHHNVAGAVPVIVNDITVLPRQGFCPSWMG
jgi:polysaccharide biosynthesis PFTS motif protein